jgi:ABC-2 type transport system permease protein
MNVMRVRAVTKKELIQISRDPLSLAMAFLMPVLLLFIFGYAITLDVDNLRTVVYDQDHSSESREFTSELVKSGYFKLVAYASNPEEITAHLDKGTSRIAVWIPLDFSKNLNSGRPAEVQFLVDGSDSNTATIALGYMAAVTDLFAGRLSGTTKAPIEPRLRVWYNSELKSRNFIVPGLVAVIMGIIAALLTSLTIAREWERGTMEQLISTPIKKAELLIGKLIPYFLIGLVDVTISVLIGVYLFGVPFRGSVSLLFLVSSIFLFGGLSLGILISVVAKSQLVASQVAMVVSYLPAFLLSGFIYSISNMPLPLQIMTRIIPARYFVALLKDIFLKANPLRFLAFDILLLSLFGVIVFAISNKKFKKKIA